MVRGVFGEILEKIILELLPFLYFRHCKCNSSKSKSVRGLEPLTSDRVQ